MDKIFQGKNVYLVGIKGAGMAGLAQILKGIGYRVKGSDIPDTFFTDDILRREKIAFHEGFDAKKIPQEIDWAVSSGAYLAQQNIEIEELKRRGVAIMSYPEALARFFNSAYGIAVTGTHGKSTTSAMIAHVLTQSGHDPFALIGAELLNWRSNARVPKNLKLTTKNYFVIEADEYREQFLYYRPQMIVVTNIDYDHSDYFATQKDYRHAFEKFTHNLKPNGVIIENATRRNFNLKVIGRHNQENATLAFEACKALGIPENEIKNALESYTGLRRRLEKIGEYKGALIFDDYAHHPAEITASLGALKKMYNRQKLIVLFHPHTYSRTNMFLKEFAQSLLLADEIYLLDVYASAREQAGEVGSDDIVKEIGALSRNAKNLKTIENAVNYFRDHLTKHDLLITMGAGDVFRVGWQLVKT